MMNQTFTRLSKNFGSTLVIGSLCALSGLVVGLGGVAAVSYANEIRSGAGDFYIPYQGQIDLGGSPVDGPTTFVFTLYDSDASAAQPIWTSDTRQIQVSNGFFSTVLGSTDDTSKITSAVMAEDALYVGMEVEGVELQGRQRLLGVPFAQNAAPGKTFVVDHQIRGMNGAKIDGTTSVSTLNATGKITGSGGANISGTTSVSTLNASSKITGNGGASFSGTTNVSTLNASSEITGSGGANISGTTELGTVSTSGTLSPYRLNVAGSRLNSDLIRFKAFSLGSASSSADAYNEINTYMSASEWNCGLAGFSFGHGDIQEGSAGHMGSAYTYIYYGNWWVRTHIRHHKTSVTNAVGGLICARKNISSTNKWWDSWTDPSSLTDIAN